MGVPAANTVSYGEFFSFLMQSKYLKWYDGVETIGLRCADYFKLELIIIIEYQFTIAFI